MTKFLFVSGLVLSSSLTLAILPPQGEYLHVSCVSTTFDPVLRAQIIKDTRNSEVKMLIRKASGPVQVFSGIKEFKLNQSVFYFARINQNQIVLEWNPTSIFKDGTKDGLLTSTLKGKIEKVKMFCNQANY